MVASSPSKKTWPPSGSSRPAMMRSRLVLPEPDGPSSATSSPVGTVMLTSVTARKNPNYFVTLRTSIDMRALRRNSPLQPGLDDQGQDGEQREQRGDSEGPGQ